MSYQFLLFDLDDTIFDFHAAETQALQALFDTAKIALTPDLRQKYHRFNQQLWQLYEDDQINRQELLTSRFPLFFRKMQLNAHGLDLDKVYRTNLGNQHQLLPGAAALLRELDKSYRLFAVTNGIANTQRKRLVDADLDQYFDDVFISEEVGCQKPLKAFYDYTFKHIPKFDKHQALIIGDSLSADVLGGQNNAVDTLWFNPHYLPNRSEVLPTYQIQTLTQLPNLLRAQR